MTVQMQVIESMTVHLQLISLRTVQVQVIQYGLCSVHECKHAYLCEEISAVVSTLTWHARGPQFKPHCRSG